MLEGQQSHHGAKICPILAAFTGSRDAVSTASTWAIRCKGSDCGWWDEEHHCCAVAVISQGLAGALVSAPAGQARSA